MTNFVTIFVLALVSIAFYVSEANTAIKVTSSYKDEVNIKIQGSGIGGCDILLEKGESSDACWCLWGTINYSFCAYKKSPLGDTAAHNATELAKDAVSSGKCPVVTGESLVCSDLSSLGNCYSGAYSCTIDANGLCHCDSV